LTKYSEVVALIPSDSSVTTESPLDYLVFKYYLPERNITVLKFSYALNDPYVAQAIQLTENNIMPGSLVIMEKETKRTIPSAWQQKFETNNFRVYEYK
jgi:hypothetical protein